jgi:hypothetical protein
MASSPQRSSEIEKKGEGLKFDLKCCVSMLTKCFFTVVAIFTWRPNEPEDHAKKSIE